MEDIKIVQLYWNRDQNAIIHTAKKYGKYCTAIAKNILGNTEDAEECVNDTYMQTWNAIPSNRPERLSVFIGKITRNLSFNRYKKSHAVKRGGSEIPAILDELGECVSGVDNIEESVEFAELVEIINTFLETVPSEKRNIFIRRYWYSDSVAAIAKAYGMKANTVSMILNRLRGKLRDYLLERGYTV